MTYRDPEARRRAVRSAQARYRATKRGARREREYRASEEGREARREAAARRWRAASLGRPFVGVDGEGAGQDELGRQPYTLLRAGEAELWRGGRALEVEEILGFLADLPLGPLYVGYFFGYDATQIVRLLPVERQRRLLSDPPAGWRGPRTVRWRGYEIEYRRRKYFRVRRDGGKYRTVSDVGSFFQCAFTRALKLWEVGTAEELTQVQAGKDRRGGDRTTDEDRRYCALEVRLLAELMERFRSVCDEANVRPARYEGPGYLASALLSQHGVPRREEVTIPAEVHEAAVAAYYGGRFEVLRFGEVGAARSYDINSAYPAAMLSLPCLLHGKWESGRGGRDLAAFTRRNPTGTWIAHLRHHCSDPLLCDLPVRTRERRILWPRSGSGWYWRPEVEAAIARGKTRVRADAWWGIVQTCDCQPFAWVPDLYAERKRLGKAGRGLVLKLGLNSLYGKTAQSIGAAPYASPVWAGLITALTRAALVRAYSRVPSASVVMMATDGIFTTGEIPGLPVGSALGEWEAKKLRDLLTVQPGCYFHGEDEVRSRGVARTAFGASREAFRETFRAAYRRGGEDLGSVRVPVRTFSGVTLALAQGHPERAGRWEDAEREVRIEWRSKRAGPLRRERGSVLTRAPEGVGESRPYDRLFGQGLGSEEWEQRVERDEQPDYVQVLPD